MTMNKIKRLGRNAARRVFSLRVFAMVLIGVLVGSMLSVVNIARTDSPLTPPPAEALGNPTWTMPGVDATQCAPVKVAVIYDDNNWRGETLDWFSGSNFNNSRYYLTDGSAQSAATMVEQKTAESFGDRNVQVGLFMGAEKATNVGTSASWDVNTHIKANDPNRVRFDYNSGGSNHHNWAQVFKDVADAGYTDVMFITGYRPTQGTTTTNLGSYETTWQVLEDARAQTARFNSFVGVGLSSPYYKDQFMRRYDINAKEGLAYVSRAERGNTDTNAAYFQPGEIQDADTVAAAMDNFFVNAIKQSPNYQNACLTVRKSRIDAENQHVQSLSGWQFTVDGVSAATNASGLAYFTPRIGSTPVSKTVTETVQDGFVFAGARCQVPSLDGPTGVQTNLTATSASLSLEPGKVYQCDMQNLPRVPVTLVNDLQVDNPQIEVNLRLHIYTYSGIQCTWQGPDGTDNVYEAADVYLDASDSEDHTSWVELPDFTVPIGASCEFTQSDRATLENRYKEPSTTVWNSVNGGAATADDLHYTVTVGSSAYDNNGLFVTATNVYSALLSTITFTVDRSAVPAGATIPADITVEVSCRYLHSYSPSVPPETLNDGTPGGIIALGNIGGTVSGDGSFTTQEVPAGTQCTLEVPTSLNVPGYTYELNWQSNACTRTEDSDPVAKPGDPVKTCSSNNVMVEAEGNYTVELKPTYTRGTSSLYVTKQWQGADGANQAGSSASYEFEVICPAGTANPSTFSLRGGETQRVTVPAADDCVITEKDGSNVSSNITVDKAAEKTVTTADVGGSTDVDMTNTASWKQGDMVITPQVDVDLPADLPADIKDAVNSVTYTITAVCRAPGADAPQTYSRSGLSRTDSFTIPGLSYTTDCDISITPSARPAGVTWSTVSVNAEVSHATENVTVHGAFTASTDTVTVRHEYTVAGTSPADAGTIFADAPNTTGEIVCSAPNQLNLSGPGDVAQLTANQAGSCTISSISSGITPDSFDWSYEVLVNGEKISGSTFAAMQNDAMVSVVIRHIYTPKTVTVTVNPDMRLSREDTGAAIPKDDPVYAGAFKNARVAQTLICKRNDVTVFETTQNVDFGDKGSYTVPYGADCMIQQRQAGSAAADLAQPSTDIDSTGALTADSSYDQTVQFTISYGAFNLKKKVDGDGVATITNAKKFNYTYQCTINGEIVKTGTLSGGRFDAPSGSNVAENNLDSLRVRDVPVGSDCVIEEQNPEVRLAQHSARWTMTQEGTGWGAESTCAQLADCQGGDNPLQVRLHISKTERTFPNPLTDGPYEEGLASVSNFQGTLVNWNTYTYERVNVKVKKELAGDNAFAAYGQTFPVSLICESPRQTSGEIADSEFTNLTGMTGSAQATAQAGYGQTPPVTNFSYNSSGETVNMTVPVGFNCRVTETVTNLYGGTVDVAYAADHAQKVEGEDNFFTLPEEVPADDAVTFTVTNTLSRERADFTVAKTISHEQANDISAQLLSENHQFDFELLCTDPALGESYSATVQVPADGSAVQVLRTDLPDELPDSDKRIPKGVSCTMTEDPSAPLPGDNNRIRYAPPMLTREIGTADPIYTTPPQDEGADTFTTLPIELNDTVKITWTNAYYADDVDFSLTKQVENAPEGVDFSAAADGYSGFEFAAVCTVPEGMDYLDGEQGFRLPDGSFFKPTAGNRSVKVTFNLLDGQQQSFHAPRGTTCEVSEAQPDYTQEPFKTLADEGLTFGPQFGDGAGEQKNPVEFGQTFTFPYEQTDTPISGDPQTNVITDVVAYNTVYRDKAPLNIEQVDASDQGIPGSSFDIYPAVEGQLGDAPVATVNNTDSALGTAHLAPGTYYLVQTRAANGAALLPGAWRFTVKPTAGGTGPTDYTDLQIELADYAANSGLITVTEPSASDDGNPNWLIQVANVALGTLPLTGGMGLWWLFIVGCGALAFSIVRRARRK